MFLDNKYTKIYYDIMDNAKSQNRSKRRRDDPEFIYYERHHIQPASLQPELANLKQHPENGVLLTAREHYIAHRLLIRMVKTPQHRYKMAGAIKRLMTNSSNQLRRYTSREYAAMRSDVFKQASMSFEDKYGAEKAVEIREKMSISKRGDGNSMYGRIHTENTKRLISEKSAERNEKLRGMTNEEIFGMEKASEIAVRISEGNKALYDKNRGKTYEEIHGADKAAEIREKLSKAGSGKKRGPSPLRGTTHKDETISAMRATALARPKTKCPHCHKMLDAGNYAQFHGDKCKNFTSIKTERPKTECSHCLRWIDVGNYARFHGDRCKAKR